MKFFETILIAAVCLVGLSIASRLSNKYLPPNFGAVGTEGSNQYPHYQQGVASRLGYQYTAAVSATVPQATPQYGKTIAANAQIPILRNEYNNDGSGNYNFGFETGHGIKRDESGHFQGSWPGGSLKVSGSYSYTGQDGKLYSVNYKADSNGFHAEGDHLPTPPPIPREIQETLHLHQHGSGSQRASAVAGHHAAARNFVAASQHSAASVIAPNPNYLPPHQGQGYNYGRHY